MLFALLYFTLNAYFGQNKVNHRSVDWSVIQTMHFDVHYPKGNDDFGRMAALMSEEAYYYLKDALQFPIATRIPLIFYGSRAEFQDTNIIYPVLSEGVGGFTESQKNRVALPFEGSYAKLEEVLTHELVHAYANALEKGLPNTFLQFKQGTLPFWFSEGLPELMAVGGNSVFNNMFVLDMVVNDNLGKLNFTDGYYAYRLGESFLTYIAEVYGKDKVVDYFFAIRAFNGLEEATKKVFGMDFKELESRWRYYLKRKFFPYINSHSIPKEMYEQRTFTMDDGSYLNLSPRFSPDGQRYVYFSNRGARFGIWLAGTQGLANPKLILKGETSGKHEEFYYFRSSLAWLPDNQHVAFVSKTTTDDTIYILNVDSGKTIAKYRLPQLDAIYEIDISPSGKHIAIAAQDNMQTDIYLYDIGMKSLIQLTNDRYHDTQPRFSPDGKSIAFASERIAGEPTSRQGFFSHYKTAIFSIDINEARLSQHTFDTQDNFMPFYSGDGSKLLFVSDAQDISNIQFIDLNNGTRATLSKTLSGVSSADISTDGEYLLMSAFFDGGFNIYFENSPYTAVDSSLVYSYPKAETWDRTSDLFAGIDLSRLDYFGKRKAPRLQRQNPQRIREAKHPFIKSYEYAPEDSLQLFRDYTWDHKPDSISVIPMPKAYRPQFFIDRLWGGGAYSPSFGYVAQLELGFSDLMGNHAIGLDLSTYGKLKNSDFFLSYLYLKQRMDYGIGVYNLYDEIIYRLIKPGPDDYFRERLREQGLYLLLRYPLSKFTRLEFDHRLYRWSYYLDDWQWTDPGFSGEWDNDPDPDTEFVYTPGLSLVHDNALYGPTGPLIGMRSLMYLRKSFTSGDDSDFLTSYMDIRSYILFNKRYSIASRVVAGLSTGKNPRRFSLGGYNGVRAYDGELSGEKKVMASLELRYPFFDYIAMAFPLPLTIGSIRGSAFADIGTVWDEDKYFRGTSNGKLADIHLGYGFGPRINLGVIIMRMDVAWSTDLSKISKPAYYLSLSEDF